MHSINNEEEHILSFAEKDHPKIKEFLESLNLEDGNEEVLQHWFYEGVWNVETKDKENFILIFGKSKIHLILKKAENYEQLREKLLKFVSF